MSKVVALYRYPVKGFTPQRCEHISVLPGGRVAGDRVLNFRFADAPVADTAWCRKIHGVVLANTRIRGRKFTVAHDCGLVINPEGLRRIIEGNIVQGLSQVLLNSC